MKRTGTHRAKLNRHDFTGIFLGYTATDQNITYLNPNSGVVKSCHHVRWSLVSPTDLTSCCRLLYDLVLEVETNYISITGLIHPTPPGTVTPISVPWPPLPLGPFLNTKSWKTPPLSLYAPLPLRITDAPHIVGAKAAWVHSQGDQHSKKQITADVVSEYLIGASDMAMIYV